MINFIKDIPGSDNFAKIEPLTKGWSSDKKYIVDTTDGRCLLLRIADIAEYDRKKTEFETIQKVADLDIPTQQPIDFGRCDSGNKVYQLLTWIEGEDAAVILPTLADTEQYALGLKAGEILQKIHSMHIQEPQEDWAAHYNRKLDSRAVRYRESGLHFDGDEMVIDYIDNHRQWFNGRPQTCQHGDYHAHNMVIDSDENLHIIDFNRNDVGDPWEEFSSIYWSVKASPNFAAGQIQGYFSGSVPDDFWDLLCFYNISCLPSNLTWSIPFGQKVVDEAKVQNIEILSWYDNLQNPIPLWYREVIVNGDR